MTQIIERPPSGNAVPRGWYRRNRFPYGLWACFDNREVLFNRYYKPIWQGWPGQPFEHANPEEWVEGIVSECWFYNDATPEAAKLRRADRALTLFLRRLPVQMMLRRRGKAFNGPLALPYGVWTCEDGLEVLFDRQYRPLAQRWPDGPELEPAWPEVADICRTRHFYRIGQRSDRAAQRAFDKWMDR